MNNNIQAYFDSQINLFTMIEDFLAAWKWDLNKTCQLPILMKHLQEQNNWDKRTLNGKDPIIRDYLRNHTMVDISRGAHGGIILRADKQKRDAEIEAKKSAIEAAKQELNKEINAKIQTKDNLLDEMKSFMNEDDNYLEMEDEC